jgi:hypothetical protein
VPLWLPPEENAAAKTAAELVRLRYAIDELRITTLICVALLAVGLLISVVVRRPNPPAPVVAESAQARVAPPKGD